MITNSNLYAERVFSEHPLALWPLDEEISFLQLLSDAQQNLSDGSYWSLSNLSSISTVDRSDTPIKTSTSSRFQLSSSSSYVAEISSTFTLNSTSDFDTTKSTACFSAHIYQGSIFIDSFEIGVSYGSTEDTKEYSFATNLGWHNISHTFDLPSNQDLTFFIRITFSNLPIASDFVTQINGISLGQWSEQYIADSIGFNDFDLPSDVEHLLVSGSGYSSVTADAYGLDTELNGYYLIKDKKIFAQNSGIPLVYGSNHTTKIFEAPNGNPSLIFPGNGFLNDSGKYNNYTLEAWVRMENVCADPIKIIGSAASNDGIYVEEGFITLRIGPYQKSYYVGKWYRPMLLHFRYTSTEASLFINGEQTISLPIDIKNVVFAQKTNLNGDDLDWIAVYGSDFINPFEIDCLSIFPYIIPLEMAKRRFVFGQGVKNTDLSNDTYSANSYLIDYPFANYAANSIYPDISSWRSGFTNNLRTTSTHLTSPEYKLPDLQLKRNSRFLNAFDWYSENKKANDTDRDQFTYLTMRPLYEYERSLIWNQVYNSGINTWGSLSSDTWYNETHEIFLNEDILYSDVSIYYDNINILDERLESVSGVFRSPNSAVLDQPIFHFRNKSTGERIGVTLKLNWLTYSFYSSSGVETVLYNEKIDDGEYFVAGFNIKDIQSAKYSIIGNFFSSLDNISLNIGGYEDAAFGGRIYAVHFNNAFFYRKDLSTYFENSFIKQISGTSNVAGDLIEYIANYSLLPSEKDYIVDFDIGVTGYWEDYQPLSFFGKYVTNEYGEESYDLDMLQLNIDMPKKSIVDETLTEILTYGALDLLYATYTDLSNILLTGYANYLELKNEGTEDAPNTRFDSNVNAFVSFQTSDEVGKKSYSSFVNINDISYNNVVEFDSSNYKNTKYEVDDNTIIFPPKTPDFKDYYIGLHLEVKIRGILYKNLQLKRLELASLAFDKTAGYPIGTKYANDMYPFARTNYLFNYKNKNPFTIFKETAPYLYLTEYSGVYVNPYNSEYERGILIPINENKEADYQTGGMQFWGRYPLATFPEIPFKIAKIKSDTVDIDFYLQPESNKTRAKLVAYDYKTGKEYKNLIFYQDSHKVENPILYPRQWTGINISLLDPIEFDNVTGRIELYSGMVFNNIGEYKYTQSVNDISKQLFKKWWQISYNPETSVSNSWQDIESPGGIGTETWADATAILVPNEYTIDGDVEYKNQVGLSVSVTEDISTMSLYSNGADVFTNVQWEVFEGSPV